MSKLLESYKRNKGLYIICSVFIAFSFSTFITGKNRTSEIQQATNETIQREYENSLLACERGNILREQVYKAITIASDSAVSKRVEYQKIIDEMKSAPTADPDTGRLDCKDPIVTKKISER